MDFLVAKLNYDEYIQDYLEMPKQTWRQMIGLIQAGLDVTPVITRHFSPEDYNKGFELLVNGQAGKVVLDWE